MPIKKDDVVKVADLARLGLTSKEAELYTEQLGRILNYVEKLSELDTKGVEPLGYGWGTLMREDKAAPSISQEKALKNAPDNERSCFKVPQIIE